LPSLYPLQSTLDLPLPINNLFVMAYNSTSINNIQEWSEQLGGGTIELVGY